MPPQFQNNVPPANNQVPRESWLFVVSMCLIALVLIFAGYLLWTGVLFLNDNPDLQSKNLQSKTDQFANWKTYTNTEYGFEIKYPSDLAIQEKMDFDDSERINLEVFIEKFGHIEVTSDEGRIFSPTVDYKFVLDLTVAGQKTKIYFFPGYDGGAPYIIVPLKVNSLYYIISIGGATISSTAQVFLDSFKFTR